MGSGFRLHVVFGKAGRLRFLSHLEIARALERTVRRAALPYATSQGFTPRMKIAFGPALPVGTAGVRETFELWLREYVDPDEAFARLRASAPEGLAPIEAHYEHDSVPSLSVHLTEAAYEIVVTVGAVGEPDSADPAATARAVEAALTEAVLSGAFETEHKGKVRRFDLGQVITAPPTVRAHDTGVAIDLHIRLGDGGSMRPEAFVTDALSRRGITICTLVVTRTDLRPAEQ